jgi:DNA-binding HxlR family transcriptional regulator
MSMRTYGQYCPVARATEVLADRWTPLIIRELLAGVSRFNEIERGLPGISRTLLAARLRGLARVGVLERVAISDGRAVEYRLTAAGRDLQRVIDVVGEWGAQWAFGDPRPDELDPGLLLWQMRRRVHLDRLPRQRVVVQFDFPGARCESYWMVMDPGEVSVCLHAPGFDVDLVVTADLATLYRVFLGRTSLAEAVRMGAVDLDGRCELKQGFWDWLAWSPMADAVRAAASGRPDPPLPPGARLPATHLRK